MNWNINNFTIRTIRGLRPEMGWGRAAWLVLKLGLIVGVLTWVLGSEVTGGIR